MNVIFIQLAAAVAVMVIGIPTFGIPTFELHRVENGWALQRARLPPDGLF